MSSRVVFGENTLAKKKKRYRTRNKTMKGQSPTEGCDIYISWQMACAILEMSLVVMGKTRLESSSGALFCDAFTFEYPSSGPMLDVSSLLTFVLILCLGIRI